ncbi:MULTISPECIES: Smr/MutS family protein [Gulbenkiania]|uniref:DNA-nicking Smr family endonuclease n=1 Tax=Gulbenkiania mobilis TaxID=397457 RepID=A0ABY2CW71_GULMO|nr:Smr/MutS family protein [Gulbenkiania indica]TCW31506.1 DNA-nicking Smr family endonuclease [Gulbenkiania mobilis]
MKRPLKEQLRHARQQVRALRESAADASANPGAAPPSIPLQSEPDFPSLFPDIVPLKPSGRHLPVVKKPSPHPKRQSLHAPTRGDIERALLFEASHWFEPVDQPHQHARPGQPHGTLRKLRNGHWPVAAELDLHGLDRHQAHDVLAVFLHRARQRGVCVRIIHGKGFGSDGQPVLKRMVRTWLGQHPDVLAFCETRPEDGGGGAVMVLLRRHP